MKEKSKEPGILYPIVNFNKCSGKDDCVRVCPHNVFEMRDIEEEDRRQLNFVGKLKTFFSKRKAYVVKPADCHSCGLCVQACPEKAIKLAKYVQDK